MTSEIVKSAELAFGMLKPVFGVIEVRGKESITQVEVDALASELDVAKKTKKQIDDAIDARVDEVKALVYAVADNEVGKNKSFTLFSESTGLKMVREVAMSGGGIDSNALLNGLYEFFGEEKNDKNGQAWKVWSKVSTPVQTRVLDEGMLATELAKSIDAERGVKHGSTTLYLPTKAVEDAKVEPKATPRFFVRKMTKEEVSSAKQGIL